MLPGTQWRLCIEIPIYRHEKIKKAKTLMTKHFQLFTRNHHIAAITITNIIYFFKNIVFCNLNII